MEGFTEYYMQELTVRFYWCIMVPTQRSVNYFCLLVRRIHKANF